MEVADERGEEKIVEGCQVYAQAAERAKGGERTISLDELTGVQALERKQPDLPTGCATTVVHPTRVAFLLNVGTRCVMPCSRRTDPIDLHCLSISRHSTLGHLLTAFCAKL
jgi:hypothetical protein